MGSEHTTGFLFCYTTIGVRTAFQVITNTKTKMLGKVAMVLTLLAALLPMERVEGGTVRSSYFINTPHNQTVTQGEELLLTCESQGGRPHAELQWRDAEGQRVFGHVQEHISTLRFNPLHPMAVTCTAHSEAFTK